MSPTKLVTLVATLALAAPAAAAAAPSSHASLLIRHETRGCHAWSVDGNAYKASQSLELRRGGVLTLTNNDVMPHTLVLTSGPAIAIPHARLAHMSASLTLRFTHPGVYRFTTKAGEDYPMMASLKTVGEDNVLRLTVVVK